MKILIVEDDPAFIDAVKAAISDVIPPDSVTFANSRDEAVRIINSRIFDIAVLDLKIPPSDGSLDAQVQHGRAVYQHLRSTSPGTPVCFLTAFGTEDFIADLLQEAERLDIWGSGDKESMVLMLPKRRLAELPALLARHKGQIEAVDGVELNAKVGLSESQARAIKIFARRYHGESAIVEPLSGGLSEVQVLRIVLRDRHGVLHQVCSARLGDRTEILHEIENYKRDILRLENGTYSVHLDSVFYGAGAVAGVFYRLIGNFVPLSLLTLKDPDRAIAVIQKLEEIERAWTLGQPQKPSTVAEIRQTQLSDGEFAALRKSFPLEKIDDFERIHVQAHWAAQHGDFHGENILVDTKTNLATLIDFSRVGLAPTCIDAVNLELSLLFHPSSKWASVKWPDSPQLANWDDIELYSANSPQPAVLKAIRAWAIRAADGQRSFLSSAYAVSARQLKFRDTNKDYALAIIGSVVKGMQKT